MREQMISINEAKSVKPGTVFHMNDETNSDGTPVRWRVTGQVKTWKTRPEQFKIPVKHGLYDYGYITESNLHLFHLES